ncbi:MAG: signal peptidase I [Lentisphaeria bacterium]|nr:signal peptidase I [Lentisphaeria bacterium]
MEKMGFTLVAVSVFLAVASALVMLISVARVLSKAGQPGWAVIVPVYNVICLLRVARMPLWWLLLFLVPVVSIVPSVLLPLGIARRFGRGGGFAMGLLFVPVGFWPLLAFGGYVCDLDPVEDAGADGVEEGGAATEEDGDA